MPYLTGPADWIMDARASVTRLWPAWSAVVAASAATAYRSRSGPGCSPASRKARAASASSCR